MMWANEHMNSSGKTGTTTQSLIEQVQCRREHKVQQNGGDKREHALRNWAAVAYVEQSMWREGKRAWTSRTREFHWLDANSEIDSTLQVGS